MRILHPCPAITEWAVVCFGYGGEAWFGDGGLVTTEDAVASKTRAVRCRHRPRQIAKITMAHRLYRSPDVDMVQIRQFRLGLSDV